MYLFKLVKEVKICRFLMIDGRRNTVRTNLPIGAFKACYTKRDNCPTPSSFTHCSVPCIQTSRNQIIQDIAAQVPHNFSIFMLKPQYISL